MQLIAPPSAGPGTAPGPLLDPLVLRESVLAAYPGSRVNFLSFLQARPEDARQIYIEGEPDASGEPRQLAADEVFVNPYTGEILGDRRWGDISQGLTNLMPFLYRLHYSLALDTIGTWAFGIVALLWTIDCFVGAWLTFPARVGGASRMPRSWWSRWKPAWKVRWQGGAYKINFDLHRAGGLWPWAMLFVLAWSSVAFNLYEPVYRPAMGTVFEFQSDPRDSLPKLTRETPEPSLGWDVALDIARLHLQREAAARHIVVMSADRASYDPQKGYLRYVARTDRDLNERRGQSAVFIDTRTGRLLATVFPTGEASGDTLTTWLTTLHMAQIWGLPFRVFVTLVGVAVAVLSGTGVVIWWKKRSARAAPLKKPLRNGNDSAGHPTGV